MNNSNFSEFIKKALEHYDNQNSKYDDYINIYDCKLNDDKFNDIYEIEFIDDKDNKIICDYEILGYFDNDNKIWIWGWLLPDLRLNQINICKYLIEYALKLESENNLNDYFMKGLLLNSRILIENILQLDINLAIYSYLIKDRILFIFPYKVNIDIKKDHYITMYYLIKNINK